MIDEKKLIEELQKHLLEYKKDDVAIGINVVKEIIGNQPKTREWIPCSERLPENRKNVLACWGGDNVSVGYHVDGGLGGWFFEALAGGYKIPYEPFAWQPLPEAYHG